MQRHKPPFRADHVGSLLRTAALKDAREKRASGALSAEAFKAIEDREIEGVIKKQEAVGLKVRHRRRISPHFVEHRFPRTARQCRVLCRRAQGEVLDLRRAAAAGAAARHRQARRLQAASDDRAFQVPEGAHQGDAEDDDPVAVVAAFPLRPRCGAGDALSGDGRFLSRSRPDLQQGGARFCRRPAAAICSSTRSISLICAIRRCAS